LYNWGSTVVHPRSNRLLFERVKSGGGIISKYYLGEAPLQWRFPARNRIIAGLSDVVVAVEAPEKSGALITARHGLEAGRDVWAVVGPFAFAEWRGSNVLLADGAGVLWDLDRFVEVVGPEAASQRLLSHKTRPLARSRFRPSCPRKKLLRSRVGASNRLGWMW
jgi:DNA processing protein